MNNPTIQDARDKLSKLAVKIKSLIADYEKETTLTVKAITLSHDNAYNNLIPELKGISVDVYVKPNPVILKRVEIDDESNKP